MIVAEINQSLLKGGQRLPEAVVKSVLRVCSRLLNVKGSPIISIGFVDPRQMRKLNKAWRGKDRVTDVLSFELNDGALKGEVLLSYDQARVQAHEMKHSVRDEVCFLIVHGILHLYGFDHETPTDAKVMFPLQEKILRSLHIDSRL